MHAPTAYVDHLPGRLAHGMRRGAAGDAKAEHQDDE
jgi:hypothetical protein